MKRLVLNAVLILGLGSCVLSFGGCSLFHEDYPDESCEDDNDCFLSQGEVCNLDTKTCEVPGTNAPAHTPEVIYEDDDASSMSTDAIDSHDQEAPDAQ